jgi:hypothetical protein
LVAMSLASRPTARRQPGSSPSESRFLVPLSALVFLRAISGDTRRRTFIIEMTAILVAQFLISLEIFATMTAVAAIALFLAWSFTPPDTRSRVAKLLLPIACAYAFAILILSPRLWPRLPDLFRQGRRNAGHSFGRGNEATPTARHRCRRITNEGSRRRGHATHARFQGNHSRSRRA